MTRDIISDKESEAALEKALQEGWITPEEVERMRREQAARRSERPPPRGPKGLLYRILAWQRRRL